jgi:hypothetical protein
MDFMEAMHHLAENDGAKVFRSGDNSFVWHDDKIVARGRPPLGLRIQRIGRGQTSEPFVPTMDDIFADDWHEYEPAALLRR